MANYTTKNKIVHILPTSIGDSIARVAVNLINELPDFEHVIVDLHAGQANMTKEYINLCSPTIAVSDQFIGLSDTIIDISDAKCVISYVEDLKTASKLSKFVYIGNSRLIYYYDIADLPAVDTNRYMFLHPTSNVFTIDCYLEQYLDKYFNHNKLIDIIKQVSNKIKPLVNNTIPRIRIILSNNFDSLSTLKSIYDVNESNKLVDIVVAPTINSYDLSMQPNSNMRLVLLTGNIKPHQSYLSLTAVANGKPVITNIDMPENIKAKYNIFNTIKTTSEIADNIVKEVEQFYLESKPTINTSLLSDQHNSILRVSMQKIVYNLVKEIYA